MADLLTFDLTPNSKAIELKTNDLIYVPEVDYQNVTIQLSLVEYIVQEENEVDGLNIVLSSGEKYTIDPKFVTRVGAVNGTVSASYGLPNDPYNVYVDSTTLRTELINLIGW